MKVNKFLPIISLFLCLFTLSACGKKDNQDIDFTNDEESIEPISPYVDELSDAKIQISQSLDPNQEFKIDYQTRNPDGQGQAFFKVESIKEINSAGQKTPESGKKLVLAKIAVMGNQDNSGDPSTFNQIGDNPSPQFVLIDKNNNKTYVEDSYYSDGYTQANNLFELSKITMDHQKWIHTAIVFEIDSEQLVDLALRFVNPNGQLEFYDIND